MVYNTNNCFSRKHLPACIKLILISITAGKSGHTERKSELNRHKLNNTAHYI